MVNNAHQSPAGERSLWTQLLFFLFLSLKKSSYYPLFFARHFEEEQNQETVLSEPSDLPYSKFRNLEPGRLGWEGVRRCLAAKFVHPDCQSLNPIPEEQRRGFTLDDK